MTIQDIGLFQAISSKVDFLSQRQSVISQNIANADTPGYRPQDLVEVDFSGMLQKELNSGGTAGVTNVSLAATDEAHMGLNGAEQGDARARKQKDLYEVAPAENSVILEEQLLNAGRNTMDYNMMINLYQKQVGMFRIALGN